MFSSVYKWAVSKVVYPPSSSSDESSISPSRPSSLSIDDKYLSDDEFIVINTSDIKQTPPPTPRLVTDFNDCIIPNYQENPNQYNNILLENASKKDSPIKDTIPSTLFLSPNKKINIEESKENHHHNNNNNTIINDEKIGFRVLRFTRDGLIKNETNEASIDRITISPLNYLSEKQQQNININKRKQEIGVIVSNNKSFIKPKNAKKIVKLMDDDSDYQGLLSLKGGKSEPDWNKINERQAAKRVLQHQRRANDKTLSKDRRAASYYKSGGKGKNKNRFDDD